MNTITNNPNIAERLQLCLPRLADTWRGDLRFADLALDSMDTVELLCVVHEEFGVRLTESDLFPEQTLNGLLNAISRLSNQQDLL